MLGGHAFWVGLFGEGGEMGTPCSCLGGAFSGAFLGGRA